MPKKILVTGATGFIGSRLVPLLLREGHQVSALVRKSSSLESYDWRKTAKTYPIDCSYAAIQEAVRSADPDVVVHLASKFLVTHTPEDVESIVGSNILFGNLLAEAMAQNGKDRLVHASTYWTHYEGAAYRPVNLYAASKRAFIDVLEYYADASGLKVVNLELYDSYGSGDKRRKIVNILLEHLGNSKPLLLSPGDQEMELVHVDDVVSALMVAVNRVSAEPSAGVKTYQVRTGKPHSIKALVGVIEKASGKKLNVVFGGRPYRSREVMRAYSGGELLPGWQAKILIEEGIKAILAGS